MTRFVFLSLLLVCACAPPPPPGLPMTHRISFDDDSETTAEAGWVCVRPPKESPIHCIDLALFLKLRAIHGANIRGETQL